MGNNNFKPNFLVDDDLKLPFVLNDEDTVPLQREKAAIIPLIKSYMLGH